jgi:preprotein translocase subunit YajC
MSAPFFGLALAVFLEIKRERKEMQQWQSLLKRLEKSVA